MNHAYKNLCGYNASISIELAMIKALKLQDRAVNDTICDICGEVEKTRNKIQPNNLDTDLMRRVQPRMCEANLVQVERSTQVVVTRQVDNIFDRQCNRDCKPY